MAYSRVDKVFSFHAKVCNAAPFSCTKYKCSLKCLCLEHDIFKSSQTTNYRESSLLFLLSKGFIERKLVAVTNENLFKILLTMKNRGMEMISFTKPGT